jgi:outer membrane immunogenic protein
MILSIRRTAFHCLTFAAAVAASMAAAPPSAVAADLPVKARTEVVQSVWTGYYIGVHGGWGWSSSQITDPTGLFLRPSDPQPELKGDGLIAGAQIGANWQYGNLVYGLELDGSWASMRTTTDNPVPAGFANGVRIEALATGTGRVGYTIGNWLTYVKAGGAWAWITTTVSNTAAGPLDSSKSHFGATAGAGMEVLLLRNVSGKVEYNFVYFPNTTINYFHPDFPARIDHYVHLVKAGINVRFGGDRVVARY